MTKNVFGIIFDFVFGSLAMCFAILGLIYGIFWIAAIEAILAFILLYLGLNRLQRKFNDSPLTIQESTNGENKE